MFNAIAICLVCLLMSAYFFLSVFSDPSYQKKDENEKRDYLNHLPDWKLVETSGT